MLAFPQAGKSTKVFSYLFYSLSTAFSYANILGKGLKLILIFICVYEWDTLPSLYKIHFTW